MQFLFLVENNSTILVQAGLDARGIDWADRRDLDGLVADRRGLRSRFGAPCYPKILKYQFL